MDGMGDPPKPQNPTKKTPKSPTEINATAAAMVVISEGHGAWRSDRFLLILGGVWFKKNKVSPLPKGIVLQVFDHLLIFLMVCWQSKNVF